MIVRSLILLFVGILWSFSSLAQEEKLKEGMLAPNILGQNTKGETVILYEIEAKVIILQFWASWNEYSIEQAKESIRPMYRVLKNEGLAVVGFSLDDSIKDWKRAISQNRINWIQISDGLGFNSPFSQEYHVKQIPSLLILDENFKILSINPTLDEMANIVEGQISKIAKNDYDN
ncbi:hypothetical protein AUTU_02160 [Aureibacter tunicatorum]|nr:hypothetical protein AUTU_02160 [Aureibacter tunicatorum]